MILGIGTDVVSIERIAGVLERHGERFVNRILTAEERARFARTRGRASHLAKRWAAKEAFSKAIGTGIHAPFTWHSISVGRAPSGAPGIVPGEAMARYLGARGGKRAHLSLTHPARIARASLFLERCHRHAGNDGDY